MDIKVEYDGQWPNLCRGNLKITIDGVLWDFGCYALRSGGEVLRDEEWNMWAEEGPWSIEDWPEGFPEDEYIRWNVIEAVNSEIPHGCCGGCI